MNLVLKLAIKGLAEQIGGGLSARGQQIKPWVQSKRQKTKVTALGEAHTSALGRRAAGLSSTCGVLKASKGRFE
jgi:hypothetical protein